MAKKEKRKVLVLDEWVEKIRTIVKSKKQTIQPPDPALPNHDVKTCLEQLHDKYVFAPADKAATNVIIFCKHLYFKYYCKRTRLVGF